MPSIEEILSQIRGRRLTGPRRPSWRLLHSIADEGAARIREEFLRAASHTNGATRIAAVEEALQRKDFGAAERAIPWDDVGVRLLTSTMPREIVDLVLAAGVAAEQLTPAGLSLRFDLTNPLATRAAGEHAAELVTRVSAATKEAIRQEIVRAIRDGRTVPEAAREIRDMIGLLPRQADALATLRESLAGRPESWIERRMARATKQALGDRATTIARTETLRAVNAGQQALWEQATESRLIQPTAQREFVVTPDDRLCPICAPLDGTTYGMNEEIETELGAVLSPPIHVNCRCVMVLVA